MTSQNPTTLGLRRGKNPGIKVDHVSGQKYPMTPRPVSTPRSVDVFRLTIPAPLARAFGLVAGEPITLELNEETGRIEISHA